MWINLTVTTQKWRGEHENLPLGTDDLQILKKKFLKNEGEIIPGFSSCIKVER